MSKKKKQGKEEKQINNDVQTVEPPAVVEGPPVGIKTEIIARLACPSCGYEMLRVNKVFHVCENRSCDAYGIKFRGDLPSVFLKEVTR